MTSAPVGTRFENDVTIPAKTATRVRSKSETPKSKREPYVPEKVLKPSATDYHKTADYIDQQAAMGLFSDTKPYTVQVAHYIWRHTVRKLSQGLGPNEKVGFMMTGKCNRAKIATECFLSLSSVDRALDSLEDKGVIKRIRGKGNDLSIAFTLTHPLSDETLLSDRQEGTVPQTGGVGSDRQDNTRIFTGISTSTTTKANDDHRGEAPSGDELDLGHLAKTLGVTSLADNIKSLATSLAASHGSAVVQSVAERCRASARSNPAGYFVRSASSMCEQEAGREAKAKAYEAQAQEEALAREEERQRKQDYTDSALAEIESLMPKVAAGWFTSEPRNAYVMARRELSKRQNVSERLEYARSRAAATEEFARTHGQIEQYEEFLVNYKTWQQQAA